MSTSPAATAPRTSERVPAPPAPVGVPDPLRIALAAGLAGGLLELLALAGVRWGVGRPVPVGPEATWMTPLGVVSLCVAAALPVALLGLRRRLPGGVRAAVIVPVTVALAGALLATGVLHPVAAALLALGVAVRAASWAASRPATLSRLVRTTIPALAATVVLLALGVHAGLALRERRSLAALPAAEAGAPNVLLIIWDTVRAASLGLYGNDVPTTPNLERLASDAVVFDHAFATAPWTLPTHASLFTGHFPHETSVTWTDPLGDVHPTLAERLRARGYRTGGFVANPFYTYRGYGLDRGFDHYQDRPLAGGQVALSTSIGRRLLLTGEGFHAGLFGRLLGRDELPARKAAPDVRRELLGWIDGGPERDRPFFAFVNLFDAHLPYHPPEPWASRFAADREPRSLRERAAREWYGMGYWDGLDAEELRGERAAYEASIAYLDHELGLLLDDLRERGLLENTVVVLTSDHGEEFGEGGGFEHGSNLLPWQTHVPLVVRPAGGAAATRVATPVSVRDLPATLLGMAGAEPGGLPGTPLLDRAGGATGSAGPVLMQLRVDPETGVRMWGLRDGERLYVSEPDGKETLYDVAADPDAPRELTADGAEPAALPAMRARLREVVVGGG